MIAYAATFEGSDYFRNIFSGDTFCCIYPFMDQESKTPKTIFNTGDEYSSAMV